MTSESRRVFVAALTADAGLGALLAVDPEDSTQPALFLYNRSFPPAHPCIVYQFGDSVPDDRFRPLNVEGGGEGPITEGRAEVRVYAKGVVATRDAIAGRVRAVLEGKVLVYPGNTGRLFRVEILTEFADQFDPAVNDFYHLFRFRLRQFR